MQLGGSRSAMKKKKTKTTPTTTTKTKSIMAAFVILIGGFYDKTSPTGGASAALTGTPGSAGGCLQSQYRCSSGRCVNLNLFCDGRNDCGDNSDEPAQCTHCNRTYYAGTGESYRLLVTWPKPNQMPFTCFLTFTSSTHDPSEFLQVRVDTATIGQYLVQSNAEVSGRCPDGCMQIWEGDQPGSLWSQSTKMSSSNNRQGSTAGGWCGASITPRFYYTDSTSVTFGLRLLAIPASLQNKLLTSSSQQHPVLDLTYRVLPRSSAIVRYGTAMADEKYHLGDLMAGTVCSRSFRSCGNDSSVQCRVQSPGYPGIYPRNAHCLYRISHRVNQVSSSSPTNLGQPPISSAGRRSYVVVLWQNDGRKINLRDWDQPVEQQQQQQQHHQQTVTSYAQQQRIRTAAECEASGDYITVYDGTSTAAPVLVRFCDGPLPEVVSSGPDVIVEFRSSPLDTIYASTTAIEGFELKVKIVTVEPVQPSLLAGSTSSSVGSTNVLGEAGKCQWNVTSSGLSRGLLTAPHQTWPLQTTCHFRFLGRPDERVWIYFVKYHFVGTSPRSSSRTSGISGSGSQQLQQCRNVLRIAEGDGAGWDPATAVVNGTLIRTQPPARSTVALFCRDRPPPLCERQLLQLQQTLSSTGGNQSMLRNNQRILPPPPCLAGESFTSEGSTLSVQQYLPEGTAFTSWKYALAYEFFKTSQDGRTLLVPVRTPNYSRTITSTTSTLTTSARTRESYDCNRLFSVHAEIRGNVKSPQNVFLFGRGGARQIRCVYRFEGDETMRVAIEVTRLRLGGRQCRSGLDPLTHHRRCSLPSTQRSSLMSQEEQKEIKDQSLTSSTQSAFLQLRERPWGGQTAGRDASDGREEKRQSAGQNVLLQRDCLCDTGLLPFRYVSTSSTVEVVFQVDDMNHADDYHDFFFEISYEFLSGMKCASQSELKPLQGPGGLITLDGLRGFGHAITSPSSCNRQSWFILPRPDRFLFLSTNGFAMNRSTDADDCPTKNRILVYSGSQGRPLAIICPSPRASLTDSNAAGAAAGVKIFAPIYGTPPESDKDLLLLADPNPVLTADVENDESWRLTNQSSPHLGQSLSTGGVVIEFIAIQSGSYQVKWLELTPQAVVHPAGSVVPLGSVSSPPHPSWYCSTWCPELKACVDSQLWCDGVYDCPSGVDEMDQQCQSGGSSHPGRSWSIPKVYWYLMAAGSTLLALFVVVSSVLVCRGGAHLTGKSSMDNYEGNGDLLSPTSPMASSSAAAATAIGGVPSSLAGSSVGGGSFRPPPIAALNDYVYPDSVSSLNVGVPSIVGGVGVVGAGSKLVLERSHYDKKMAVS